MYDICVPKFFIETPCLSAKQFGMSKCKTMAWLDSFSQYRSRFLQVPHGGLSRNYHFLFPKIEADLVAMPYGEVVTEE